MDSTLYDRPDLYDRVSAPDPCMEAFYLDAARERPGSVLELACGTGRFAVPLARAGLDIAAGDLSEKMLDAARKAAAAAQVSIPFHQLDMRDFDLGATFDTIFVATNSLLHLHTVDDFRSFFASVERHLAPEGRLLFDIFVPSASILSRQPGERHLVMTSGAGDDEVTLEETTRYDPATQMSHVEWIWSRPGEPDFWRNQLLLRQIFPQELPLLIATGGLRLIQRFGAFDRSPFGPDSRHQVCICGR